MTPFVKSARYPLESFIRLETADDSTTLVAEDGSLVTLIRVDGSRILIGDEEYRYIIEAATTKIGSRFDQPGYAMQFFFARDPARSRAQIEDLVQPSNVSVEAMDLDLDDLMRERTRHLSHYILKEDYYVVLWTRPSVLNKNDVERAGKLAKSRKWVVAPDAQYPFAALDQLRTRHSSFVSGILTMFEDLSIKAEELEVHDALTSIRNVLHPDLANDKWRACIPGDPIPPRAQKSAGDLSDILWPPLRQQLTAAHAEIKNDHMVRIGRKLWSGCDMTLGPMDPSPFPVLMNRLFEAGVPFRISFLIEGGGVQGSTLKASVASVLAATNAQNRSIKNSLTQLQAYARGQPVVRMRVSLATWANEGQEDLLEDRLSTLIQSTEAWGYTQVSTLIGDPLDCVMSSALGISCASTAPPAVAPLAEVFKLIPWQRPSSPFETGSIMLRTPDGKVWPYMTGSSLTTTWFDLIFAQPGAGKSVLMNTLNLGTILGPGQSKLPYVAVIDIGPSSAGLISMIKEALPPNRKHEAAHYRWQMSPQYAVNPFDTQMGCREPLMDERAYLIELLILLTTPPGQDKPYDGMQQLAGLVVDEMFRWRADGQANAEPRPYLPRLDSDIDEALSKYNIHLPTDPYWWDVVDKFFDLGEYHLAGLAQRHAVPVLGDAITAARRPQIRSLLEDTQIGNSSENVINAFERMITSAIREYPILSAVTKFDIAGARVCALDLMDVSPQGDESADRQTAIMYMLARHCLIRSWWVNTDSLRQIPEKYQIYHEARMSDISETPKRLCYDEFHRTSKSKSVRNQIIRDVREGRKRGVQIVLSSQLLDDFDKDMVDLATGVWVLGTAISDNAVDAAQERFGLSNTARNIIRYRLTGPRSGGAPCLFVLGSNEGRYEQHLINTLGPIELWALSTSTEDVAIRDRLYARLGARRSRQMLAASFPGGSARPEIKRRVMTRSEKGEIHAAATSEVIKEIVEEIVAASERQANAAINMDSGSPKPIKKPSFKTESDE